MSRFIRTDRPGQRAILSWLFVAALFVLCGVLGFLQYRWIGEVSVAYRDRLRATLQASLDRLSRDFNLEIAAASRALLPAEPQPNLRELETEVADRYRLWRRTTRHGHLFQRIAVAAVQNDQVVLWSLHPETGAFEPADWPDGWKPVRERLESRLSPRPRGEGRNQPGPPRGAEGLLIELPLFGMRAPRTPPLPFARREIRWLICEINLAYVRDVLLPELVQHHLETDGTLDYEIEVLTRADPPALVYQSDPGQAKRIAAKPDASAGLFDLRYERIFRPWGSPGLRARGEPEHREPERGPGPDFGRWQIFARHRAGSLEAVVARTRWRNLAVTGGVLLLMLASVAALIRFTRRAQKLAELQMEFVAGVSHELRTPLTVIHTAAYNLQGTVAGNPSQVERYGALIQKESGRLKELVEQVLRFAGAKAGRVIRESEPLSVEEVIEETLEASRTILQGSRCVVEKSIDPELPLIQGDPTALKHALQNLLSNAAKYGARETNWIGVFASRASDKQHPMVEIRVADRGPGIPEDEQERIFDPFFRGRRAVQDQVHGTGLGLNLAKKIVEAHGGSIQVKSQPTKGTEFIVRIPALSTGAPL